MVHSLIIYVIRLLSKAIVVPQFCTVLIFPRVLLSNIESHTGSSQLRNAKDYVRELSLPSVVLIFSDRLPKKAESFQLSKVPITLVLNDEMS
jgi:hypothetical protein